MNHEIQKGTNDKVIITLHGTGGSASDLFQIARYIDKEATLIGFQGQVVESGMARYFERNRDGSFNLESLKEATKDLKASIDEVIEEYGLQDARIALLGYSNGANIGQSYLKTFEDTPIDLAFLFHPSATLPGQDFKKQGNLSVLITSGANDPYISEEQFEQIQTELLNAHIDFQVLSHSHGHQLVQAELEKSKQMYDQYVFNFDKVDDKTKKKLVQASIIPRPIAWVESKNEDGSTNLAPFSYFNMLSPNFIAISFQGQKDTYRNIVREKEARVHSVSLDMLEKMDQTGLGLEVGDSEAEKFDIDLDTMSKTSLGVSLEEEINLSDGSNVLILKVNSAKISESVYDRQKGYILADKLNPVARLAGPNYAKIQELDYQRKF